MATSNINIKFPSKEIGFGVELEFVFAFHEDELRCSGHQIKKNLNYVTRERYPELRQLHWQIMYIIVGE
jgi:hypothetical protein